MKYASDFLLCDTNIFKYKGNQVVKSIKAYKIVIHPLILNRYPLNVKLILATLAWYLMWFLR